jgi:uncharacterized protein (DUF58 family)
MIPTLRLLYCCAAWALLGVAASVWPQLESAWHWVGLAAGIVLLGDAMWMFMQKRVEMTRRPSPRMALGVEQEMEITLRNPDVQSVRVRVQDGLPASLRSGDWPWTGRVPARGFTTVAVRVRAVERGPAVLEPGFVEHYSPLGLWGRRYRAGTAEETRVFPNYEPVVRFALLAMQHREAQMGIQRRNKQGLSREFRQLRDYQDGDTLNRIDWKATSRRLTLTSREYEEQRNQTIILMADCGRRLRAMDGELSQFDHCLNAMLLLSFIALRQGDRVGIMGFGGSDRWLPPQSGQSAMPVILNHLYDYRTGSAPGDFSEAAEILLRRQQRRSLVVFCTNLRSEDHTHLLRPLQLIRRRHLTVVASLREREVLARLHSPVHSLDTARSYGAAAQYTTERSLLLHNLRQAGILTIDAPAEVLPVALGNLYLDINREAVL